MFVAPLTCHTHAHIHVCSGSGRSSIRINRERMDEETFEEGYKPSKRKNTLFKKFVEKLEIVIQYLQFDQPNRISDLRIEIDQEVLKEFFSRFVMLSDSLARDYTHIN